MMCIKTGVLMIIVLTAADFNFTNQNNITFSTGDTVGEQQCVLVNITDDDTVEKNETFLVSFTTVDPVVVFASDQLSQTEVVIIDDDGKFKQHVPVVACLSASSFSLPV